MAIIAPSILSADFLHLHDEIQMLNSSDADWIHIDVMDGVFVPNLTFGFPIISQIKNITTKPLDVHLMIVNPEIYIAEFQKAGADILTVHYETQKHLHRTIEKIKFQGMKAGVSLNPHTPVHVLEDVIRLLDLVLIMSVNPGFGGQSFIQNTYKKIGALRRLIEESDTQCIIEVDGGVNLDNAPLLMKEGVDALVAGNAIFKSSDPKKIISQLKSF